MVLLRRRYPLVLTAALLLAGAGSAAALGSGQDDSHPAREEIASLGTDASISVPQAERELRNQRRLPALVSAGRDLLGRDYGGVWVAARTRRITLGVLAANGRLAPAARQRAQDAVRLAGLEDAARIVATRHSEAELLALQRRLEAQFAIVNRGARIPVEVSADLAASKVSVSAPSTGRTTRAQARTLDSAIKAHASLVHVTRTAFAGRLR